MEQRNGWGKEGKFMDNFVHFDVVLEFGNYQRNQLNFDQNWGLKFGNKNGEYFCSGELAATLKL